MQSALWKMGKHPLGLRFKAMVGALANSTLARIVGLSLPPLNMP